MKSILPILCLVCLSVSAPANNYIFSGTTGDWNISSNRTPAGIPVAGDDVSIYAGKVVNIHGCYAAAAQSVYISGGGILDVLTTGPLAINGSSGDGTSLGDAGTKFSQFRHYQY